MGNDAANFSLKTLEEESLKGTKMTIYFRWLFISLLLILISIQSFAGYFMESLHSVFLLLFYVIANLLLWLAWRAKYDPLWVRYFSGSVDIGVILFHLFFLTAYFDIYAVTSAATILLLPLILLLYTLKLDRYLVLYLVLFTVVGYTAIYLWSYPAHSALYQASLSFSPLSHFFKAIYIILIGLLCIYLQYTYKQILDKKIEEINKQAHLNTIIEVEKQKNTLANELIEKERILNKQLEKEIHAKETLAEDLRYSQEQYRSIIANLVGAAYRCMPDDKWTMVFISTQIEDITGYKVSDFIHNKNIGYKDILHPDDKEWTVSYINDNVNKGKEFELEYRIINKKGETVWIHETGRGVFDSNGKLSFLEGIITNINDKKQAELKLKETQELINSLISNLTGAASRCLNDDKFTVKFYTEKIFDITGYKAEEFVDNKSLSYSDIMHPDDVKMSKEKVEEAINKRSHYSFEYRIKHRDGSTRWVMESGQPIFNDKGEVLHLDGISVDVTDKKKAEEALKESERKFRAIVETSPVAISFAGYDDKIAFVNKTFVDIFGYTIDEIPDMPTYLEKIYPDKAYRESILPEWNSAIENARKTGASVKPFQVQMTSKDGSIRNVVIHTALLSDGIFAVFNDVTEMKKANMALQESEKKYRELMDFLPQTIYELDLDGNLIFTNKVGREIFGIERYDDDNKVSALNYFVPKTESVSLLMCANALLASSMKTTTNIRL